MLAEQTAAVDPRRLGAAVGRLTFEEMRPVDASLRLMLDLWSPVEGVVADDLWPLPTYQEMLYIL